MRITTVDKYDTAFLALVVVSIICRCVKPTGVLDILFGELSGALFLVMAWYYFKKTSEAAKPWTPMRKIWLCWMTIGGAALIIVSIFNNLLTNAVALLTMALAVVIIEVETVFGLARNVMGSFRLKAFFSLLINFVILVLAIAFFVWTGVNDDFVVALKAIIG